MARAIAHLFWGERHLSELRRSISGSIDLALPRIAITDERTAAAVRADAEQGLFERVIVFEPGPYDLLAKSALFGLLPIQYDTFLFLDTDVVVLDDVSLGFEKAERFGLAAAIAPHYSLEHFWDFGRVMDAMNIARRNQLQYNSGVLFFARCSAVERVMKKWNELCIEIGYTNGYKNDQPFLTLAMELLDFNPYTLSPAYNYRALGELASGNVRVWHSHSAVPEDVNVFSETWPPRRFWGGRRLAFWPEPAAQAPEEPSVPARRTVRTDQFS